MCNCPNDGRMQSDLSAIYFWRRIERMASAGAVQSDGAGGGIQRVFVAIASIQSIRSIAEAIDPSRLADITSWRWLTASQRAAPPVSDCPRLIPIWKPWVNIFRFKPVVYPSYLMMRAWICMKIIDWKNIPSSQYKLISCRVSRSAAVEYIRKLRLFLARIS